MPIRRTSLFASNPYPDHRTLSLRMVGERRRIFLIQARREGAYSENHFFAAARALRPTLPASRRAGHGRIRSALSQLAWADLKAIATTESLRDSLNGREVASANSSYEICAVVARV